ncbi:MAG: magnesium transporter CorA family protein [Bacteroidia bacterium]|jgi:magnesium transporter|nr:magnesium transporter CorA family protein [Bacteroidia bacterium]
MIQYYKSVGNQLTEIQSVEKDCWINVVSPSAAELDFLSQKLLVPIDFLSDPLDTDESARIEQHKNCLLIVVRIPLAMGWDEELPFITLPVGIILKRDLIVTICSKPNEVLSSMLTNQVRNLYTQKRERLVMQLFLKSSTLFLRYLKIINNKADEIQRTLHKATRNKELIELLNFEKSLVYFTTSLKSNELMMSRLQRATSQALQNGLDEDLMEDVTTETKQAIEMANIYSNILSNMMGAHSSIISNNLNITIRFLTSVTIILSLPILVASLYGMNVELPFERNPDAFWIVMGIAVGLASLGVIYFRKNNLF